MNKKELNWKTDDGLNVYGEIHTPEGAAKAVVIIVHGMGEYCSRYKNVVEKLLPERYAIFGFDHRGHGRSAGAKGHTPSLAHLISDISSAIDKAEKEFPSLPVFLYGHSMGGNLVLNYLIRNKPSIAGAVVTGPWIKLAFEPPAIKVTVGKLLRKWLPGFTQGTGLKPEDISRDPEVVNAYKKDPLVHDKISTSFFFDVFEAGNRLLDQPVSLSVPLLIMHGAEDKLTSPKATLQFAEAAKGDVTLKIWPNLTHELHNEPEKAEVLEMILNWMEKQLKKTKAVV